MSCEKRVLRETDVCVEGIRLVKVTLDVSTVGGIELTTDSSGEIFFKKANSSSLFYHQLEILH